MASHLPAKTVNVLVAEVLEIASQNLAEIAKHVRYGDASQVSAYLPVLSTLINASNSELEPPTKKIKTNDETAVPVKPTAFNPANIPVPVPASKKKKEVKPKFDHVWGLEELELLEKLRVKHDDEYDLIVVDFRKEFARSVKDIKNLLEKYSLAEPLKGKKPQKKIVPAPQAKSESGSAEASDEEDNPHSSSAEEEEGEQADEMDEIENSDSS